MARFILHLGYPKTGTTYLQRHIFSQLTDQLVLITPELQNCGINIKRLGYQIQQGEVPASMRRKLRDGRVLFSREMLFDSIIATTGGRFAPQSWPQTLRGLQSLTGAARADEIAVVLYLRRQDDLLHSVFAERKTSHFNHIARLATLEKYASAVANERHHPHQPGYYYDFSNTIAEIHAAFPDSSLHIRFYEDLERDAAGELRFWSRLCGAPLRAIQSRRFTAPNTKLPSIAFRCAVSIP